MLLILRIITFFWLHRNSVFSVRFFSAESSCDDGNNEDDSDDVHDKISSQLHLRGDDFVKDVNTILDIISEQGSPTIQHQNPSPTSESLVLSSETIGRILVLERRRKDYRSGGVTGAWTGGFANKLIGDGDRPWRLYFWGWWWCPDIDLSQYFFIVQLKKFQILTSKKCKRERKTIWCGQTMIKFILLFNLIVEKNFPMMGNKFPFPC
jgi:hypothetical protein